jgi:hypothetical protein
MNYGGGLRNSIHQNSCVEHRKNIYAYLTYVICVNRQIVSQYGIGKTSIEIKSDNQVK